MKAGSQNRNAQANGDALRWSGRVVTAEGLRESLNGERELVITPGTVITPLAADHLKANGIQVVRREESAKPQAKDQEKSTESWGYVIERPFPLADSVIHSLQREGMDLQELSIPRHSETETHACGLARSTAQVVSRGGCLGAIVFCVDPLLVCCVANKVKGIRAAAVVSPAQANRAVNGLGVNFLVLEIGKQTFFELRQIIRCVCGGSCVCSAAVTGILKELETGCQCQTQSHGGPPVGLERAPPVGLEEKCHCGGGHAHR
jgi:ribose 5-phosphate isomerase RpiB